MVLYCFHVTYVETTERQIETAIQSTRKHKLIWLLRIAWNESANHYIREQTMELHLNNSVRDQGGHIYRQFQKIE